MDEHEYSCSPLFQSLRCRDSILLTSASGPQRLARVSGCVLRSSMGTAWLMCARTDIPSQTSLGTTIATKPSRTLFAGLARWTMKTLVSSTMAVLLAAGNVACSPKAETQPGSGDDRETAPSRTATRTGFAPVEGGRIAYQVYGDLASGKSPLLVLHGSQMSAEAMAPMIEPFVASRPVVAFDARGHGRTGDVPGPITYERLADDAAAVLRAVGVKRADVLGYSMGGTTAIILAVRHPDL